MELYIFNPENDLALANNDIHFIPPRSARVMAADLSMLPAWWAGSGAAVWVDDADAARRLQLASCGCCPRVSWLYNPEVADAYRERGHVLPWAAQWTEGVSGATGMPAQVVSTVVPWGWSPQLTERLRAMGVKETVLPDTDTLALYRSLSGRQTAVTVLEEIHVRAETCRPYLLGESFVCEDELSLIRRMTAYPATLLKAPWSGSGKGLRPGQAKYEGQLAGWCRRVLHDQGAVVVEPLYDKVMDFAMEFYADGQGTVCFQGLSLFDNTRQGAYSGNLLCSEAGKYERLRTYVPETVIDEVRDLVQKILGERVGGSYRGYLGVDMMVCRVPEAPGFRVHPCVEINMRMTMGMVALYLSRLLSPAVTGRFTVRYEPGPGVLLEQQKTLVARLPRRMERGQITGGFWPLTPVSEHTHYAAEMTVEGKV